VLDAQGLGKCRAEGQYLAGSVQEQVWADARLPALGCLVSISPRRTSPSPALQGLS